MAVTETYANSVTVSTTELSLITGNSTLQSNTTAGVYQFFIDINNLIANNSLSFAIYEKAISTGTKRVVYSTVLNGMISTKVFASPALALINGWDATLDMTAGADRTIDWSIRKVG